MKIAVTANAKMQTLALTIDGDQWANLTEAEARMLRFELWAGIEDLERSRCYPSAEEERCLKQSNS